MGLIAVIAVVFLALLALPFAVPLLSLRTSKDASLHIKSDNVRDPRYFSNAFRRMIEEGADQKTRTIQMSRPEPFVYAEEVWGDACNTLVVADHPFRPSGVKRFYKEIYAKSSAELPANTTLRAIACLDSLILREGCAVIRWADAEKQITVLPGCALGMSATSAKRLLIGPRCTFRRLYAPEIVAGCEPARAARRRPADMSVSGERWINSGEVKAYATVRRTIVTDYALEIGEGAVILGSVKSTRQLHVRRNARINGNLIADGAIVLHEGARVLGNVFSQDSILVGPGVEIGVRPKIKSLIARKSITLCETARVFGYAGSEADSATIAREDFDAELRRKPWAAGAQPPVAQEPAPVQKATSPAANVATGDAQEEHEEDSLFD